MLNEDDCYVSMRCECLDGYKGTHCEMRTSSTGKLDLGILFIPMQCSAQCSKGMKLKKLDIVILLLQITI